MAGFNEILEGGLNNSLAKRLGMQTGSPSPTLTPEIFPVLDLGVAWEELAFNQGWRRWQAPMFQLAGATFPRFQLRNPSGSNVLVMIEEIQIISAGPVGTGTFFAETRYATAADLGTAWNVHSPRDNRQAPSNLGVLRLSSETNAAAVIGTAARMPNALGGPIYMPGMPILLWSGSLILFGFDTAQSATANIVWSERGMQRGEQLG